MRRTILIALVVAGVAIVPIGGVAAAGSSDVVDAERAQVDGNATVAPGERLAGVIGVQGAELEGEVDRRAFGLEVANATTNESKADAVAGQLDRIRGRLADLDERKRALNESRNGSMSEGRYRAEIAELAARTQTVQSLANVSENATRGLPAELLESKEIDATAIQTLREQASRLAGPAVAEIARSIAGPVMGPPGDRGPTDRPGGPGGEMTPRGGPDRGGQENPMGGDATVTPDGTATADGGVSTPDGGSDRQPTARGGM